MAHLPPAAIRFLCGLLLCSAPPCRAASVDLSRAVVVTRPGQLPNAEQTAARVFIEEVEKRTGLRLRTSESWPQRETAIAITAATHVPGWGRAVPVRGGQNLAEARPEGYRLYLEEGRYPVVWVIGADGRGVLYGVGQLLRRLDWAKGKLDLAAPLDLATAPAYAIRGHQLGYRTQANSWDVWDVSQFEQYIRELAFFGANSIENIPFQDERATPLMKVPRREMNRAMSEICARYGLDYWVWTPADFDLKDGARRARMLTQFDELFRDCPELTGVFFPGGDPGSNPPELVLPFLEEVAQRLRPVHPKVKIWLSQQWFSEKQVDFIYRYIERESPAWLGGMVAGPSSPPAVETRRRLPRQYKLRLYPDITHNKLCQFQVPEWDQAYALTLGREAVNPRPSEFALIHDRLAPTSDGFISYSDGVHDDVNKTIWSALSWDPGLSVRSILVDYARVFFAPTVAEEAADAILALERNWSGPLKDNGAVEGTLLLWQRLERRAPELAGQWRWQMCLLRTCYDAYIRRRLLNETRLEDQANTILAEARTRGADRAMAAASEVLNQAVTEPVAGDLRARIVELCDRLFHSIGLQTSVGKYHASGEERGAILDFIDYPLNNRWWLEDEFGKFRSLGSEAEKCRRLAGLAAWEHPGPGSFYDDVGNIANSPHVTHSGSEGRDEPTFWWWDEGKSRARLSWQVTMWPDAVVYEGVDPEATYVVRSTGYGQALLRINGERVEPAVNGTGMGEFKEFPVPAHCLKERRLVLTWDRPVGERQLNWRRRSRLAEVWLLKK